MTVTFLFDLDDTLLSNDVETFIPAYLKALSKHLAPFVAPEKMNASLWKATQHMVENQDPQKTLEEIFDTVFYPGIGVPKDEIYPSIEQFYREVFPSLHTLTAPRPLMAGLARKLLQQGHTVVVATNPIFPRAAIEERLRWAGLPPEDTGLHLITTYEGQHFAKPNPAYFAEILGQIGSPNQPAVMIGNSLRDDILPAITIGLPAFYLNGTPAELPASAHPLSGAGSIEDLCAWTEKITAQDLPLDLTSGSLTPQGTLAILRATPAAMLTLCASLPSFAEIQPPQPCEWNLTEIVCHLRDVEEEVNLPRFDRLLKENNPFIAGIDTDRWISIRNYSSQNGREALNCFVEKRKQFLEQLEQLTPEEWQRPARHAIFGPTTLIEMASFVISHDRSHLQQTVHNLRAVHRERSA